MKYRADIDGLRAWAVLPVIFYHVGYTWAPGGFTGVDVFFVISGFLITNLIQKQTSNSKFSFGVFYSRRIKRLFPALAVVIVATLIAGFLLFSPDDFERLAGSALFAPIGLSNYYFWSEAGYWDAVKYTKPLLHTWSLAVEEQFYLIWPLTLVLALRIHRFAALAIIVTASLLALIASEMLMDKYPSATFYLTPFRIAEFGLGAVLVWLPALRSQILQLFSLCIGLALIVLSTLFITETMRFPGLIALIPAFGAAFAIYGGRAPFVSLLLTNSVSVWIGKVSYSAYLIHWPLIVFWMYFQGDKLSSSDQIAIVLISLLLSFILYFLIEQPARNSSKFSATSFSLVAASATIVLITFTAIVWANDGLPKRVAGNGERIAYGGGACSYPFCEEGGVQGNDKVVVLGDSHARMYHAGIKSVSEEANFGFAIFHQDSYCRFVNDDNKNVDRDYDCSERLESFYEYVEKHQPKHIIFAHRWKNVAKHLPLNERGDFIAERFKSLMDDARMSSVEKALVILSVPEFNNGESNPKSCLTVPTFIRQPSCSEEPVEKFLDTRRLNRQILDGIRANTPININVEFKNPFKFFCPENIVCKQVISGHSLYSDEHHLSVRGSRYLVQRYDLVTFVSDQ